MGLFDFLMAAPYEQRKVAKYEKDGLIVDTAAMNDTEHLYETAVKHPDYNNDKWVIVKEYDSKEEAQTGHDKWVKIMTENPPEKLIDVSTTDLRKLVNSLDSDDV